MIARTVQVLGDENKRKQYDSWGSAGDFGTGPGGFEGFSSNIDPEELFRKIFGDLGFGDRGGGGGFHSTFGDFGFGENTSQQVVKS